MTKTVETTALMKPEDIAGQFPVLVSGSSKALDILREQMDDDDLSIFSLTRIGVMPGGVNQFAIKHPSGREESAQELMGVILLRRKMRGYWPDGQELGMPPSCFSDDAKIGVGDINGSGDIETRRCKTCPMAQFGSALKNGQRTKGQACQLRNILFFMREGNKGIPDLINASPTSAGVIQGYIMEMAGEEMFAHHVVTKVKLIKEKNDAGQPYSVMQFEKIGVLDPKLQAGSNAIHEAIQKLFSNTKIDAEAAATILSDATPNDEE
jgi:hypothetical protein